MAGGIDLWGCMIIVFVIVAGMVVVIKILLEFPGLLQWKCVYSEHEHEERVPSGPAYLRRDLELGSSRYKSPRASKHSLHKSNSRVMETEMVEMGSKSSQVHWSRASDQNNHHHNENNFHSNVNNHHHNESNRIEREHEKSRHHDTRGNHQVERNGRAGLKSSKETVVIEAEVVTSSSTTSKTRQMNIDPSSPGIARQC